jgi:uncharacterized iron-regulated membrane protein
MTLRSFIFWPHLVAGVLAGTVIFIMSVTGVLLTYERQIIAWGDRDFRSAPVPPDASRLSVAALASRVADAHRDAPITSIQASARPDAPVTVVLGRRTLFVDAYSGAVLGEASRTGARALMSSLREWHRWLAINGENRPTARAITGWCNALFLFIVMSGFYLWFPRKWTMSSVRAVTLFNGRLSGKARDFNWHNVIGVWSCVPLFFVVITAMPISFPWANALLFRAVGEAPPAPAAAAPAAGRDRGEAPRAAALSGVDASWAAASRQVDGWRTITMRFPAGADAPFVFTIDRGDGGQPQLRDTLTVARSGEVLRFEPFASQTLGRRLRLLSRFTHTGEALGLAGQTVAGLVSAGGAVLVFTGLALTWRRFRAWLKRRADERVTVVESRRSTAA